LCAIKPRQARGRDAVGLMRRFLLPVLLTPLLAGPASVAAAGPTRGELLYDTHCIACHNSQMHWRDRRLATDWESLRAQVRRWQGAAHLGWSEDDVLEVTRHLNDRIYRFPVPGDQRTSMLAPSSSGH
jgi:hypothetical protein